MFQVFDFFGASTRPHCHTSQGAVLSGLYVVKAGQESNDSSVVVEFEDPRGVNPPFGQEKQISNN